MELKNTLENNGIETTGYVTNLTKETTRELRQNSKEWQYMNNYFAEFWYRNTGEAESNQFALDKYLGGNNPNEQASSQDEKGKVEITASISKKMFKDLETTKQVRIKYLKGEPLSAKILNEDGGISMPQLQFFGYICVFLALGTLLSLYQYMKTGTTM